MGRYALKESFFWRKHKYQLMLITTPNKNYPADVERISGRNPEDIHHPDNEFPGQKKIWLFLKFESKCSKHKLHCQHIKPILSFEHKLDVILARFWSNDSYKGGKTASNSLQFCNGDASGATSGEFEFEFDQSKLNHLRSNRENLTLVFCHLCTRKRVLGEYVFLTF